MASDDSELQPKGQIWLLVILVLLIFAGALVYFARRNPDFLNFDQADLTANPTSSRQARLYTVFYNIGVFSPTNIRVHAGDSVKFQNDSDQPIHILSDNTDGKPDLVGFDSLGDVPAESVFTYTFTKEGIFGYHNQYTKTERGTVTVRP